MITISVKPKKVEYIATIGLNKENDFALDIKGENFSYEGTIKVNNNCFCIYNDWGQWMRYYTASGSRGCESATMFFYDKHSLLEFRNEIVLSNKIRVSFTKTQFELITEIFHQIMILFMDYCKTTIATIRSMELDRQFQEKKNEAEILFEVVCAFNSGDFSNLTVSHANICKRFSSYIKSELEKRNGKS